MSGLSTYAAGKFLGWIKGTSAGTAPTALYVALFSSDPTDSGSGGTEVTTTIEAAGRVAVTFGAVAAKKIANDADVDFGNADGAATVSHVGVFDASTSGNMIGSFALSSPRAVGAGDPVKFAIGDLVIDLSTP
jgi:hypothetical protein